MTKLKTRSLKDLPIKTTPITDEDYVINTNNGTTKLKVKDITKNLDKNVSKLNSDVKEILEKGTTVETIKNATEKEIQKQIASGNMTNLTIADGSITKEKLDPNIKFGIEDGEVTNEKIANEAITTSKIRSISLEKIEEFDIAVAAGANIYNKETMYEQGHWTEGGTFSPAPDYYSTGYIEVKPLTTYTKSGMRVVNGENRFDVGHPVAFFDKDKRIILPTTRANTFTTPSNCKYINTLVTVPNAIETVQYPYNTTRRLFAIVEGNALPEKYPSWSKAIYSSKQLVIDGGALTEHSIQDKHISPTSSLGTVYAGYGAPPKNAQLWFIPPFDPKDIAFVSDGLVIYLDGRVGKLTESSVQNLGLAKDILRSWSNNTLAKGGFKCVNNWYSISPGYSLISHVKNPDGINPTIFQEEDITIMVRCRIPLEITPPWTPQTSVFSIGTDDDWFGYYLKPLRAEGRFVVDSQGIFNSNPMATLKGKDIIFTVRKSGNTMNMFINNTPCGTHNHDKVIVSKWQNHAKFNYSITLDLGSLLVYNRALSDEEILSNIEAEIKARGDVSDVYALLTDFDMKEDDYNV